MKQLVKFEKEWADEFTVETFSVNDKKEFEKLFALAEIYFELFPGQELEVSFGTNESLTFENYKDYRDSFEVIDIKDNEAEVFQKYFYVYLPENPPEFGTGSGVFEHNMFYDEFFKLLDAGELPDDVIEKLKKIEPEFETWMKYDLDEI